jgi:hypothetical protein
MDPVQLDLSERVALLEMDPQVAFRPLFAVCFAYSSAQKLEAECFLESQVNFYHSVWFHSPEKDIPLDMYAYDTESGR